MLVFSLDNDILKVKETMYSFLGTETKLVEYNINTWESRVYPNQFTPMSEGMIDYVKKYYLPKVGLQSTERSI